MLVNDSLQQDKNIMRLKKNCQSIKLFKLHIEIPEFMNTLMAAIMKQIEYIFEQSFDAAISFGKITSKPKPGPNTSRYF